MIVNRRYPGTTPFEKEQRDIFFGREKDIDNLQELIKFEPLILLYSKSGLGKSSLLNAGIQPKLEMQPNTQVINIRFTRHTTDSTSPLNNIISKIATTTNKRSLLDRIIKDENSLWYHIKKNQLENEANQKYILIFDQFEELFSYPEKEIYQFKKQLADLLYVQIPQHFRDELSELLELDSEYITKKELEKLHHAIDLKVITAIRADKMSQLNELTDYLPNILKNFYQLQPLDRERAKDAIINPAQSDGEFLSDKFNYDPVLLENILNYLTEDDTKTIETFQLQIICARAEIISLRKKKRFPELTEQIVDQEDLHDLKNIFAQHYDETISSIKDKDQQLSARKLLEDKLIVDGNRISLPDVLILKEEGIDEKLVDHLVNSRILRAEPNTVGGLSYELSHDTLVEPILAARKKRVEQEEKTRAEEERLEELRLAKEKAEHDRVEFEKKRRQQRKIIAIVSIAAVISIAFGIFGFVNMSIARAQKVRVTDLMVTGMLRDAQAYVDKEEYEVAMQKYYYLSDSVLEGTTTQAIDKKISECKSLDSISKIFYGYLTELDTLIASDSISKLLTAKLLFVKITALNYKPGASKLKAKQTTYEVKVDNVITDKVRIAEMMINAGLNEDAVDVVRETEQLSPDNSGIKNLKKQLGIN